MVPADWLRHFAQHSINTGSLPIESHPRDILLISAGNLPLLNPHSFILVDRRGWAKHKLQYLYIFWIDPVQFFTFCPGM
jgi:hypothetical protein